MHPFARLVDIAQRSRHNASSLPQQMEAVTYWRGVGFMLAGQRFMVDMNDVSEILLPPRLTRVPGVRNWVLGVSNVRGRLVSVMDLAGMLGLPSKANWRSRRVMVVEHGDHYVGLLVDAVLGMQQLDVDTRGDLEMELAEACQPYVSSAFRRDSMEWPVFNIRELIGSPAFMQIAV